MKRSLFPLIFRVGTQALTFLIPLLILKFYSTDTYGVVVILIGLQALNTIADWGKQIPFQNKISQVGLSDSTIIDWFFKKNNFFFHLIINLLICVVAIYLTPYWIKFIIGNASSSLLISYKQSINYVIIASSVFGVLFPADSLLIGLGHIQKKYLLDFFSSFFILILLVLFIFLKVNVVYVLDCALSVPLVMRVTSSCYVFVRRKRIKRKDYLGELSKNNSGFSLPKLSIMFFYLQILSLVANNIDSLYLANNVKINLFDIAKFGFYIKIFGLSILLINLLNAIRAPEISSNAYSLKGKFAFPILKRLIKSNILISLSYSVVIFITIKLILRIVGKTELLDYPFAFAISAQMFISSIRNSFTVFINSAEIMIHNLLGNTTFSLLQVPLKVVLITHFGIYGIPFSNIFGYIFLLLPFHVSALYFHKKKERDFVLGTKKE